MAVLFTSIIGEKGIRDLKFLRKDTDRPMDMHWCELKEETFFDIATNYKVDDEDGIHIRCSYAVVRNAYTKQVHNVYFLGSGVDAEVR